MGLRIGLAFLAFFIYACGVLSLHPERHSGYLVEADFSLAAAVSYSVYGTPLGAADSNVRSVFRKIYTDNRFSVQEAMARTSAADLPAGDVLKMHNDGIGAGYPIFASLAMRLFGPHLSSLTYSFLLLLGISTLAFICRFQDDRLFMVPLLFFALTLMLLSPLASESECPTGGYRYFTVAGILSALHIFFELTGRLQPGKNAAMSNLVLLGLQALIFAIVMLIRSSVGYLLGPIVLAALFGIWANRRSGTELRQMLGKIVCVVVAGIALVAFVAASVPDYVKAGRLFGNTWHRAFSGLGVHPDWPFGNLREVYDCTDEIPEGLTPGITDRNVQCVFKFSYPPALTGELTKEEIDAHLYDGIYEKVVRAAFFDVVYSYPRKIVELYLYYKSAMILETLRESIQISLSEQTATILALAIMQCVVFAVFVVWSAYRGSSEITLGAKVMFALFALSLLPLYFAWARLATSTDTIAFMYAGAAIVLVILVQTIIERIFRAPRSDISRSLSGGSRLHTVRVVVVLIVCAGVAWASRTYFLSDEVKKAELRTVQPSSQIKSLPAKTPIVRQVTNIEELPSLPETPSGPDKWDLIQGLQAEVAHESTVVSGQRILRLIAAGANSRHALGARFGNLAPGRVYRAVAWVKAKPGVLVMIEARDDSRDPKTGEPSNYGVVRFNLAARSILKSTGDILASGVDAATDDWVKVWVDLRSSDGKAFVLLGLLGGLNPDSDFNAAAQEVTFGGFEISEVGSSPTERPLVTPATNISELPSLPVSSSAPNGWDLIEGLSAAVEIPVVVAGQRILRLVAVGADSRHALGVHFGNLAPSGIYRATAWVKAEPGVRVMMEARDAIDPLTGKPSNYGVARFNLADRSVIDSMGDILATGVEVATDDWVKVWVDLRSRKGELFVTIGLLEGPSNQHVFEATSQTVTFGGVEISRRK